MCSIYNYIIIEAVTFPIKLSRWSLCCLSLWVGQAGKVNGEGSTTPTHQGEETTMGPEL